MSSVLVPEGISDARNTSLTEVINERFDALPVEKALVWHLASADEPRLEAVAEALGLTGPEFRAVTAPPLEIIAQGVLLRRLKGTPWALREVLRRLNYGEITLVEDTNVKHNGAITRNGARKHSTYHWATIIVLFTVTTPFSADQVRLVWDVVTAWKRASSHIVSLGFLQTGVSKPTMYFARP